MPPQMLIMPWNGLTLVHYVGCTGWSEAATTNAPVEDEPVQPVLWMNIFPARRDFFFHLLSAPKFSTSPLLPTPSYLPPTKPTPPLLPPPSYLPPTNPTPPILHH